MGVERDWQVLLVGGASGVGKTQVSYRLARHYGIGITEVDDFQIILERMTDPERYPVLHYWRLHWEEARRMDEDQQLEFMLSCSRLIAEALSPVIANHLETRAPVVLEGDFILPSLAVQATYEDLPNDEQVRAIFLYEENEEQLGVNYLSREGEAQPGRARASYRHSEWLRQEAARWRADHPLPSMGDGIGTSYCHDRFGPKATAVGGHATMVGGRRASL